MRLFLEKKNALDTAIIFILLLLSCIPYLCKLDSLPIQLWDESRVSMNALCMYYNGDWGMTYFFDEPELWNTKPPLLIWTQVIFMKLLGPGELAIRLPSALAAIATNVLLFWTAKRVYHNYLSGIMAAFILSTTPIFVNIHGMRTGDYDSLLLFFICGFIISAFFCAQAYREEKSKRAHHLLYITSIILSLAVLTKGIQALIALPIVLVFVFIYGGYKRILKDKHLYFSVLIFILIVGAWYLGREIKSPGYLEAIWQNELAGRFLDYEAANHHSAYFYITFLWEKYPWGTAFFGVGLLYTFLCEQKIIRQFALYLSLCIIFYLLILSISVTKIWWYIFPVLPLMALIIAGLGYPVSCRIKKLIHPIGIAPISMLITVFFFAIPFAGIMKKIQEKDFYLYYSVEEDFGNYLRKLNKMEDKKEIYAHPLIIVYDEHYNSRAHLNFYILQLNKKGINEIQYKNKEDLQAGDFVCIAEDWVEEYILDKYEIEEVGSEGNNMKFLRILEHK